MFMEPFIFHAVTDCMIPSFFFFHCFALNYRLQVPGERCNVDACRLVVSHTGLAILSSFRSKKVIVYFFVWIIVIADD